MVRSWSAVGGRSSITSRLNFSGGLLCWASVRAFLRRRRASFDDDERVLWLDRRMRQTNPDRRVTHKMES